MNTDKPTPLEQEIENRREEIKDELESLFKSNLKISHWDVPEVDGQKSSEMILEILQEKLDELRVEVKEKKYEYS
ncbi:MAG: Unknown protein [uncultured Sulfurovum sp.]|uniref:Uncharacterized protein n=1 Tax=uncultured Sulfurovum sp. TaxID=269237 RepID=A0A6S6S7F0_9BACT|nr:MAG: Unknown protein [uncultured Sulfurovum sp.]